jgi:hypothetical protein
MPLTGGPSDKIGNRYEARWAVHCMVQILEEHAYSIRLEPPGEEGRGAEFCLRINGSTEYHQVKRQITAEGRWTLGTLNTRGVLGFFLDKLRSSSAKCVFVSTHSAFEIEELTQRARDAKTLDEFLRHFQTSEDIRSAFGKLRAFWHQCTDEECYSLLKRIRIDTISENLLFSNLESKLAALVDGDTSTLVDTLTQYGFDNIHHELTANEIWKHLESRQMRKRHWASDALVIGHVDAQNTRYLSGLRYFLIRGRFIPRAEPDSIIANILREGSKCGVMLAGEAGVGKSAVIMRVIEILHGNGIPFICFRIDNLEPTPNPAQVGQQLGLPASPAPVLANIAKGRPCVLIIDQLDSISLASGRNTAFFDCIKAIIDQAVAHSNMRLLVACRKYDLENDHRLRLLVGKRGKLEEQPLSRLAPDVINQVVNELGLNAARLTDRQRDLLSVPERLKLLSEIADEEGIGNLSFGAEKDLYDQYWDYKDRILRIRLGQGHQMSLATDVICDYMEEKQILSVPKALLDNYSGTCDAMLSEHILVQEEGRYRFFHEAFFDYCFARKFFREERKLMDLLLKGEQHLSKRAQVRQILTYQRDEDFDGYIKNLESVLIDDRVRFHIKAMILDMLAYIDSPGKEEWKVLSGLITSADRDLSRYAWMTLRPLHEAPLSWLKLIDSMGLLEEWLAGDNEEVIEWTVFLLSIWQRSMPDRVAQLLTPFIYYKGKWPARFAYIIGGADLHKGRAFFELFMRLINEELLDFGQGSDQTIDLGDILYLLPDKRPEWACEVAGLILRNRLLSYRNNPESHQAGRYSLDARRVFGDNDLFQRCASGAPLGFIEHVLPRVLDIIELDESSETSEMQIAFAKVFGSHNHIHGIIKSAETAFSAAANLKPEKFKLWLGSLSPRHIKFLSTYLLAGFNALGQTYSNQSACFLAANLNVLIEGGFFNPEKVHKIWMLLSSISPFCTDNNLDILSNKIMDYYPPWEMDAQGLRYRGNTQYQLLVGIIDSRRSPGVRQRIGEWKRKHGEKTLDLKSLPRSGRIGSPVPDNVISMMTDEQWVGAMAKYSGSRSINHRLNELVGDVSELSQKLEVEAKKDPSRFGNLLLGLPGDIRPEYYDAILRGIAKVGGDPEELLRLCEKAHGLIDNPCSRSIAEVVKENASKDLPERLLDIIIWYALEYRSEGEAEWVTEDQDDKIGWNLEIRSINTVRGQAIQAIALVVYHHPEKAAFFKSVLAELVEDPSMLVRCSACLALVYLFQHDSALAIGLFNKLVDTGDELLCTRYAEDFIHYATYRHFNSLKTAIERMLDSQIGEVAAAGARQACIASLTHKEAVELARRSLQGTEPHRYGAAQIYSANLDKADLRSTCENALMVLFKDESEKVREKAASCFYKLTNTDIMEYPELIGDFINSKSFESNHRVLFMALENSKLELSELVIEACTKFLDNAGRNASGIATSEALTASKAGKIIIRLYSQSRSESIRARCLDVIDRMIRIGSSMIDETLKNYEGAIN